MVVIRSKEYRLILESPLHIGGEKGIRPSIIDQKVFRRVKLDEAVGGFKEVVVIPASTIKGLMRSAFEDKLRNYVLSKLELNSANPTSSEASDEQSLLKLIGESIGLALGGTALLFSKQGIDVVTTINSLIERIEREQQVITDSYLCRFLKFNKKDLKEGIEKGLSSVQNNDRIINNLGNELIKRIAINTYYMITSFLPLVCDPTNTLTSCLPDTSIFDLARDRFVTFRFLLNIALLRKNPLVIEMCPVCLMFGGMGRSSPLIITDAEAEDNLEVLPTVTRVSIDRYTHAAKRGKLYTIEYVPPGTVFKGEIKIIEDYLHPIYKKPIRENEDMYLYLKIIGDLLKEIGSRGLGGMRSIGYGLARVDKNDEKGEDKDVFSNLIELFIEEFKEFIDRRGLSEVSSFIKSKLIASGLDEDLAKDVIKLIENIANTAFRNYYALFNSDKSVGG